ncbi:zinc-binding metallopeptidase family protein [Cellulomonas sp. S1-8]|uniref:zinc-binding metallopeptidase family protein n=1 Tax=Cellulomonas sp. S1-8 TaxID=2904790 RepID=UPI002243AB05|nr:putative zinc-binding metallopeptidase [Cellulomonas sp. S1-8]UZN02865.1 putative zinc-binding peptidase [Cellulomonas sp. S1-8]
MRLFRCPRCRAVAFIETVVCDACGLQMGLHPPTLSMRPAPEQGGDVEGTWWFPCSNRSWRCNWLAAADSGSGQCVSCRLTRTRPDNADTLALEKLATASADKRRLLVQLADLGLPLTPWHEKKGGLGFDLLSSRSSGNRVVIGHASGIVTIDLAESLDAHREALRISLGEPYRTMLGHFRHEVGHYYQWVLVEQTDWIAECRTLLGDERTSYSDAVARHYRTGAPRDWNEGYISEYATMHPWEDFAECFAHYLHLTSTLQTAASGSLTVRIEGVPHLPDGDVTPRSSYADATMDEILADWIPLATFLNRVNRAMGKGDLYPFGIVAPVARKLDFVHRVVTASRVETPFG